MPLPIPQQYYITYNKNYECVSVLRFGKASKNYNNIRHIQWNGKYTWSVVFL